MAWTTPRLWTTGELVTASMMNTHVRDNTAYLKGSAGTIAFESGATFNGAVSVTGTLGASSTISGVAGAFSGRVVASGADSSGISTASGSLGSLEIAPASGGGASRIAFHRPGAFAAYLGIDTDNIWRVGGWSMGAVAYALILDTATQTLSNKTLTDPRWTGISGFATTVNDLTNYMYAYSAGTLTLPAAAGRAGQIRFLKAWGANITVNSGSGNLMAPGSTGAIVSSFTLNNGDSLTMVCDGTYWWTV